MKTIFWMMILISGFVRAEKLSERILGFSISEKGVIFQVPTGGCTSKDNFSIESLETLPVQVHLIRNKADLCKAYFPYGVKLEYTFEELGLRSGEEFLIKNEFARFRAR